MDLDTQRIRDLLDKRDDIDAELQIIFGGTKERKPSSCGSCGESGHTARSCPKKPPATPQQ